MVQNKLLSWVRTSSVLRIPTAQPLTAIQNRLRGLEAGPLIGAHRRKRRMVSSGSPETFNTPKEARTKAPSAGAVLERALKIGKAARKKKGGSPGPSKACGSEPESLIA